MSEQTDTWGDYSKLVLKELERLNENYDKMRVDMESRFNELNRKLSEVKNLESKVDSNAKWIERVNDVWSPTQMKEAKDELYKQKNKMTAAFAIITFIQILAGYIFSFWLKSK
jgi:peptidoglycan hydrolase CwlO-like protein